MYKSKPNSRIQKRYDDYTYDKRHCSIWLVRCYLLGQKQKQTES